MGQRRVPDPSSTCFRFRTETGSLYEIVRAGIATFWLRLSTTSESGPLRTEWGRLLAWPDVRVGRPVELWSVPLLQQPDPLGRDARLVRTTRVVSIGDDEDLAVRPGLPPAWPSFRDVRVGDEVIRLAAGEEVMRIRITGIDELYLYVGHRGLGWKFDRDTGIEVDEEIGWDRGGIVGTYLARVEPDQGTRGRRR